MTPASVRSCLRRRGVTPAALATVVSLALAGCGGSSPPRAESAGVRVGSWTTAGALVTARGGQTESTLANGNVLVVGGQVVEFYSGFKSSELFDPATGKWKAAAEMAAARTGHSATVLADGRVLAIGGVVTPGNGINSAEIYDPTANTWSPAGAMATARFNHTATLLADGKVLVAGGYSVVDAPGLKSAELYDPTTNSWSATADMAGGRGIHTATRLADGKVLIAAGNEVGAFRRTAADSTSTTATTGGLGATAATGEGEVDTAELYDPASRSWVATGKLTKGRSAHTATTLQNGKVLVVGGFSPDGELDSAELYDPATGSWAATDPLATPRSIHAAVLLPSGEVLVTGGQVGSSGSILSSTLTTADLYDPATAKWKRAADMGSPRTAHTSTLLATGQVLIVGGLNTTGPVPDTELFTLKAKASI